jgi:hypothetical protein
MENIYKIKNRNCIIFSFLIFLILIYLMNKFLTKVSNLKLITDKDVYEYAVNEGPRIVLNSI